MKTTRDSFGSKNENERAVFRYQLVSLLKGYERKEARPELLRILEGVQSNDPFTMNKLKDKKKLEKVKKSFKEKTMDGVIAKPIVTEESDFKSQKSSVTVKSNVKKLTKKRRLNTMRS